MSVHAEIQLELSERQTTGRHTGQKQSCCWKTM